MGCVNSDGTLSVVARRVLEAVPQGAAEAELANLAGVPVYRLRASLRELKEAGFLEERDGALTLTNRGTEALD